MSSYTSNDRKPPVADNHKKWRRIGWKSISSEKMATIRKQLTGLNRPDYALTEFGENAYWITWITLPSFQTGNGNTTKLKGLIKTIGAKAESLQNADTVRSIPGATHIGSPTRLLSIARQFDVTTARYWRALVHARDIDRAFPVTHGRE